MKSRRIDMMFDTSFRKNTSSSEVTPHICASSYPRRTEPPPPVAVHRPKLSPLSYFLYKLRIFDMPTRIDCHNHANFEALGIGHFKSRWISIDGD